MASMSWMPVLTNTQETEAMDDQHATVSNTVQVTDRFATSAGFTHTNLTASPSTGLTELERPPVSWTATTGMGLMAMRTGACSAYLPQPTKCTSSVAGSMLTRLKRVMRSTKSVEIFDMVNKSWVPSVEEMEEEQQYHGCAVVGDKIYAIGDHHPFSSPAVEATGLVQVYDANAGNWSYGTSMPGNQSVGLAGVESQNGMIYVAGGEQRLTVRIQPTGSFATTP